VPPGNLGENIAPAAARAGFRAQKKKIEKKNTANIRLKALHKPFTAVQPRASASLPA
jgi:hypothetical protein